MHRAQDAPHQAVREAEILFEEAQTSLNVDDYDKALEFLRQATALDANNQDYLSAYGSLLAEVGKAREAIEVLQSGVQRFPETGFEKYMYLGQLLEGEAAIQNLQKGIGMMQHMVAEEVDRDEANDLRSQLASGLCSLAEMHMASDKDIEAAATECEPLLQEARQADMASPEPLQVLASLRNEQGRIDEALQLLKQSVALWFRKPKEDNEDVNERDKESIGSGDTEDEQEAMEEDLVTPSFEFRFECAKLLIELDETTETAIEILEELMHENDQAVHVVFLLAMAYHAGGDDSIALEYITEGETLITRLAIPSDDPSILGFQKLKERVQEGATEMNGHS